MSVRTGWMIAGAIATASYGCVTRGGGASSGPVGGEDTGGVADPAGMQRLEPAPAALTVVQEPCLAGRRDLEPTDAAPMLWAGMARPLGADAAGYKPFVFFRLSCE